MRFGGDVKGGLGPSYFNLTTFLPYTNENFRSEIGVSGRKVAGLRVYYLLKIESSINRWRRSSFAVATKSMTATLSIRLTIRSGVSKT